MSGAGDLKAKGGGSFGMRTGREVGWGAVSADSLAGEVWLGGFGFRQDQWHSRWKVLEVWQKG